MPLFLQTERLALRRFTLKDAPLLKQLDDDPQVMHFLGTRTLTTVSDYENLLRDRWLPYYQLSPERGVWAIEKPQNLEEFVGWICLRPALDYKFAVEADFGPDDLELGYRLQQADWGQGYATELSKALVSYAFQETAAQQVVATALTTNLASTRVMEKAGLRRKCEFRLPGYETAAVKYALSRTEQTSAVCNVGVNAATVLQCSEVLTSDSLHLA